MKKYTVHYDYYATVDVEVLADSEEEALFKSGANEIPVEDFYFTFDTKEVVSEEEVDDLETMIEKASSIIKNYDADNRGIYKVERYPTINSKVVWDGEVWKRIKNIVEDFYWDKEKSELGMIVNENEEILISELEDEIDVFNICQTIIESEKLNGIES